MATVLFFCNSIICTLDNGLTLIVLSQKTQLTEESIVTPDDGMICQNIY
jgi:hypothetical protein